MSDTITGYTNKLSGEVIAAICGTAIKMTPFNLKFDESLELYNFPQATVDRSDLSNFAITDSKHSDTAAILLEEFDYDPADTEIEGGGHKFPTSLKERVTHIINIIDVVVMHHCVNEFGVSITTCEEIEHIRNLNAADYKMQLEADLLNSCPSNTLYVIGK